MSRYNTKLHLMAKFQSWSFGKCGVPLHRHYSRVPSMSCPVGWGCWIHRLLLNTPTGYDTKQSDGEVPIITWALGNAEYPFIAITPRSTLARSGSPWESPIFGSNRTKLRTYAKLNCLKWNSFLHWNCTKAKLNCLNSNCLTKLNSLK